EHIPAGRVAEAISLAADLHGIVRAAEVTAPGAHVAGGARAKDPRRLTVQALQTAVEEVREVRWQVLGRLGGMTRRPPVSELEHIVGSAHLGAGTDRRSLPAAEGMPSHARARDVAGRLAAARVPTPVPAPALAPF